MAIEGVRRHKHGAKHRCRVLEHDPLDAVWEPNHYVVPVANAPGVQALRNVDSSRIEIFVGQPAYSLALVLETHDCFPLGGVTSRHDKSVSQGVFTRVVLDVVHVRSFVGFDRRLKKLLAVDPVCQRVPDPSPRERCFSAEGAPRLRACPIEHVHGLTPRRVPFGPRKSRQ